MHYCIILELELAILFEKPRTSDIKFTPGCVPKISKTLAVADQSVASILKFKV